MENEKSTMYEDNLFSKSMDGIHYVKKYFKGCGVDVGCGSNRVHRHVLSVDKNPEWEYANACVVHDCKDLECFAPEVFDFIFSSHCLEDFENIPEVFGKWWTRLRLGGLMVLLLPDMENGRYASVKSGGNPSHRTDTGPEYFKKLLVESGLNYEIVQIDSIPHNEGCTFDIVIKRCT